IITSSFFLCFSFVAKAQDLIVIPSPLWDSLYSAERNTAYYIDTTNSMSIDAVMRQPFRPTADPHEDLQSYERRKVTAWLRWRIVNPKAKNTRIVLIFHRLSLFSLYLADAGGVRFLKDRPAFYTSQTKNQRRSSLIDLPPKTTVALYARINNPTKNIIAGYPLLADAKGWKEETANSLYDHRYFIFVDVVFLGIIFFIIIHTLAQYFFNRRKEFLLYAFYGTVVLAYFLFKFDEIN